MQQRHRLPPLILSHASPVGAARLARGGLTGAGRNAVKDRPVQRLVDDLVFGGHGVQPLVFNASLLADQLRRVAFDRTPILNGQAA